MPEINDLNLKNWKEKIIIIYGDKYKIRKTYDINDFLGLGIYGYEVYNEDDNLLKYFEGVGNLMILKDRIKANFYNT